MLGLSCAEETDMTFTQVWVMISLQRLCVPLCTQIPKEKTDRWLCLFTDTTIGPKFIFKQVLFNVSPQIWHCRHYLLTFVLMECQMKFHSPFTERFCIIAAMKACLYASFVCSHWTKQSWHKSCNIALSIEVFVSSLLFDEWTICLFVSLWTPSDQHTPVPHCRHPFTQTVTISAGRTEAEQNCPRIVLSNFHTDGEVE